MSWFNRLERRLDPVAIPNLTLYLVIGQAFVYLSAMLGLMDVRRLLLVPALVTHGEWWRLITFIFIPPGSHWVFIAFALYFLYLTGSALEQYWGTIRYNLFLFTGYALTVGLAFVTPTQLATNVFIGGAIFLAFAYINPEFVLYLFFVLPVKIRWLAWIAWAGYAFSFFTGDLSAKLSVVAAVGNFLLFFGRDIWLDIKQGRRRMQAQAQRAAEERGEREPRHRCYVCNKTDVTHPDLDFRYCSKCSGDQCYCPEHIREHAHVVSEEKPS